MPRSMGLLGLLVGVVALLALKIDSGFANTPANADEENGPVFVKEPPSKVDFSNSTGAEIPCQARGNPQPEIIWLRADGTAVGDVPGLRQVLASGALVFPPFRAEDYRQEVHAQTYICLARNTVGTIHSRDVHVRAVVSQAYAANVMEEYVIRGNSGLMKCHLPAFVSDFVSVNSWFQDQSPIDRNDNYVVNQHYAAKVFEEDVIRGNSAIFKCGIPAYISDFLQVDTWFQDDVPITRDDKYVVAQFYEVDPIKEHSIRGNNAIMKCQVPSYVADFLAVTEWQTTTGESFTPNPNQYVVSQQFIVEVHNEHVIRGNSATLRCVIPAFVADFMAVIAWIDNDEQSYSSGPTNNFAVAQFYATEVHNIYVIKGNSAILKCEVPSFVADFLHIVAWLDEEDNSYVFNSNAPQVVSQNYASEIISEYVIRGNNAVLKCNIPAFVADFVHVINWVDSDSRVIEFGSGVVSQSYDTYGDQEHIIRGNSAILKCKIPSFVADFLDVISWQDDIGNVFLADGKSNVVTQNYNTYGDQEDIIRGNSAILKCKIPSFVADFLEVISWRDDVGNVFLPDGKSFVVSQFYESEADNEYVIKGNNVIVKCEVPSFVADFLQVTAWIDSDDNKYLPEKAFDGKFVVLPSGELHIKDVRPEDGFKEYRCQTKHRLTGETRLSASAGKLVITGKEKT
ncbi:unnamed protein product [Allacma fusca]|uniref:Ig-like domain-containing protein n=1 Tax=Allacma fusca TaxID=39272 RepID=A0A8J2JI67_9HEXA|nr:unnamed protein product [Allacma fusca]